VVLWQRRHPIELQIGKGEVTGFYTQVRDKFVTRLRVSVFNVASMIADCKQKAHALLQWSIP
jgi:hypothetical protein